MSFILDALKKSETDRQRQTGPALFEVKVAPPKAGFPMWAIAIVVLLVINMVIVGWMLLRRSSKADEAAQNTPPAAASQQATLGNNRGTWSPSVATIPPPTNMTPREAQYNNAPQQSYGTQDTQQRGAQEWQQPQRGSGGGDQNEPTLGNGGGVNGSAGANGGAGINGGAGAGGAGGTAGGVAGGM